MMNYDLTDPFKAGNDRMNKISAEIREEANHVKNPVIKIRESLEQHIRGFESELKEEQEVMIMAASFGSSITFYVDSIEFNQPSMIIFHGTTIDGGPTRLIQHCNQLSFLLQAAPKQEPETARVPIGFIHT